MAILGDLQANVLTHVEFVGQHTCVVVFTLHWQLLVHLKQLVHLFGLGHALSVAGLSGDLLHGLERHSGGWLRRESETGVVGKINTNI